jgi:hypothetical protein
MVRKDYVAIAAAIAARHAYGEDSAQAQDALDSVAEGIAEHIEEDDKGFDRVRFLSAAGADAAVAHSYGL